MHEPETEHEIEDGLRHRIAPCDGADSPHGTKDRERGVIVRGHDEGGHQDPHHGVVLRERDPDPRMQDGSRAQRQGRGQRPGHCGCVDWSSATTIVGGPECLRLREGLPLSARSPARASSRARVHEHVEFPGGRVVGDRFNCQVNTPMTMRSVCSMSDELSALTNIQPPSPTSCLAVFPETIAGDTRSCGVARKAKVVSRTPVTTMSPVSSHMISASLYPIARSPAIPTSLPSRDTIHTCVHRSWRWLAPRTALKTCPGICMGTPTIPRMNATLAGTGQRFGDRECMQQPRHGGKREQRQTAETNYEDERGRHRVRQRGVVTLGDMRGRELRHSRREAQLQQAHVTADRTDDQPDPRGGIAHARDGGGEQQQVDGQVHREPHIVPCGVAHDRPADVRRAHEKSI